MATRCTQVHEENETSLILELKSKLFSLDLHEVWRYRDLIWLFTKRSFQLSYKQTVLGPVWFFISPTILDGSNSVFRRINLAAFTLVPATIEIG